MSGITIPMASPLNVYPIATSNVLLPNVNIFTTSYHNHSWLQSFIVIKNSLLSQQSPTITTSVRRIVARHHAAAK